MARLRSRLVFATVASLAVTSLLATSALATAPTGTAPTGVDASAPVVFSAGAWGTTVHTNPRIVGSGKTALASLGCTRTIGLVRTNSAASVTLPDLADVGQIDSLATTTQSGDTYTAEGTSTIEDVGLLGGDVQIQGIETVATAFKDADGFHARVQTTIGSLTIGGVPIELTGPEQVIDIPGVAKLTLAHAEKTSRANRSSASGTAITLELLGSGAVVKIGNARASTDARAIDRLFGVGAWTSFVTTLDGHVTAGKTAVQKMPCRGTDGEDRSNSTLEGDLGGLGTIGVTTSTVNATATPLKEATVTAEVADVTIPFAGLASLKITGVKAQAHAIEDAQGNVTTDLGSSTVGSIKITPLIGPVIDIPIPAQPNTSITLPLGLGTIKFMTTTDLHNGRELKVVALELILPLLDADVSLGKADVWIKQ